MHTSNSPIIDAVESRFFVWDDAGMGRELLWSNSADRFDAIAHIIPARTKALGQSNIGGEILRGSDLEYSTSNHDHSAVFHGYFGDKSKDRKIYWRNILKVVFELVDYSGLKI